MLCSAVLCIAGFGVIYIYTIAVPARGVLCFERLLGSTALFNYMYVSNRFKSGITCFFCSVLLQKCVKLGSWATVRHSFSRDAFLLS